jgi:hypothetical protein
MTPDADFNWVRERSECSAGKIFQQLALELEQDVGAINSLRGSSPRYGFNFKQVGASISVSVEGNRLNRSVVFSLDDNRILVRLPGEKSFAATVTLCNDGKCRLRVNEETYSSWQFRKMTLEDLFFNDPWLSPSEVKP